MGYNFTYWNTFTTDFDTELILSALPSHSKLLLKEKMEKNIKQQQKSLLDELKALNVSREDDDEEFSSSFGCRKSEAHLGEAKPMTGGDSVYETKMQLLNRLKKSSSSGVFSIKASRNGFVKNKKKKLFKNSAFHSSMGDLRHASASDSPHENFNFDEYFEKNHKISTNQNFRFTSLISTEQKNDENDSDDNFVLQKLAPARLATHTNNNSQIPSSKTRLNYKLNSYKDNNVNRFHPYNNVSFESISKGGDKNGNGVSSFLESTTKLDNLKNLFNVHSTEIDKYSKYLVWDVKVIRKLYNCLMKCSDFAIT